MSHIVFQSVHQDLDAIYDEYLRLREKIMKHLEGVPEDSEQAKFFRTELEIINSKLGGLRGLHSAYLQRYIISFSWHVCKYKKVLGPEPER